MQMILSGLKQRSSDVDYALELLTHERHVYI